MLEAPCCYSRAVSNENTPAPSEPPLSLSRLRSAFAAMLGQTEPSSEASNEPAAPAEQGTSFQTVRSSVASCEINPRSVVEAMLFIGTADNRAFSSRELAAAMRGVSPAEIDEAVVALNAAYDRDQAAYRIEKSNSGYRLVLREEFARVRTKFGGRVRDAKLSPAALEVLSIVAYHQPVNSDAISSLRDAPSGAALSTLVRHRLLRVERSAERGAKPLYWTTDRFLKLFGLESLEALPRSEELEKI